MPKVLTKRCPFCGAKARITNNRTVSAQIVGTVECTGCRAKIERFSPPNIEYADSKVKEFVIKAWNQRITPGQLLHNLVKERI